MKIGYACIPVTSTARTTRSLKLNNYNEENLKELIKLNLLDLKQILNFNKEKNIYLFRISSDIIPLGSHSINTFNWSEFFKKDLFEIGEFIKKNNMRVSMHPGQYTVLNSNKEEVVKKSLIDLEFHCKFLDSLNLDYSHKIILHIGGVYGNKENAIRRFINNFYNLSSSVQKRLIIENDEKNFSIDDVLYISSIINIPVVFDNLHNECNINKNNNIKNIISSVEKTWKKEDGNMKIHYSQQNPNKKRGSHSNTINLEIFLNYITNLNENIDIMLEVKDKEISCIKCINAIKELNENTIDYHTLKDEFDKYKLLLLEYDFSLLNKDFNIFSSIVELYNFIDSSKTKDITFENYKLALKTAYKYIHNNATNREISHFNSLINSTDLNMLISAKTYLKKLCLKYKIQKLISSYFFSEI